MSEHANAPHEKQRGWSQYVRFAAMILTGMVVMYGTMFVGVWEWGHIRFSESRVFMALTMGGAMGLVMFAWMARMYRNTKGNIAIIAVSLVLLGAASTSIAVR
ncbi:hypothetical protein [Microbacterium sp. JZ31]|uniref:hypothetical protein n=1 Tax=Microbacterium sp. JZ31 TaxID=1906274 RepID=UPI001EE3DF6E|nr:hypothetical protein [Microbacterium sp. JZ31]